VKLAIVVLAALAGVASAEPTEAERLYTEGQKAYDAERYADAIAQWTQSYELSHLPALVFNIGQAYRHHGDCAKAVDAYKKFVALDPKSAERGTAEGFITELSPCPAEAPAPPPAVTAPPPSKQTPEGHEPIADTGRGKRIAGIAIAAGGLAIAATGLYFGAEAASLGDEVRKACATGCAYPAIRDKDEAGRRDETIQWILYGASAATLVTGGVLYVLGSRKPSPVAVAPHGNGAVVTLLGRF